MVKNKKTFNKLMKGIIGIGLILFAVIPTPDDITIISPVLAFSFGTKLVIEAFK